AAATLRYGSAGAQRGNLLEELDQGLIPAPGHPVADRVLGLLPQPARAGDGNPVRVDVYRHGLSEKHGVVLPMEDGIADGFAKNSLGNLELVPPPGVLNDRIGAQVLPHRLYCL